MLILAVDPGTSESGWCLFDGSRVLASGVLANRPMLERIAAAGASEADLLAIEMVASYGMAVGREVFETCVWIGRMQQVWPDPEAVRLIYRRDVKLELCGSARAKDSNIRQALIDRLGPVGLKRSPGPLYGLRSHAWSALAVAVTACAARPEVAPPRLLRAGGIRGYPLPTSMESGPSMKHSAKAEVGNG